MCANNSSICRPRQTKIIKETGRPSDEDSTFPPLLSAPFNNHFLVTNM